MYEYNFSAKIGDKTISCRAFTLEEYLNLITAKNNGKLKGAVQELIKNCTSAKDLNKQEAELLLVHLWSQSLGEVNHENTWKCTCGHESKVYINLLHTRIDDSDDLWYTLGDIKLKLRYPELFDDENVAEMIVKCMESVYSNGENININDLNEREINDLYAYITEQDVVNIKELLLKPTVNLSLPVKCEACGENHIHTLRGLKDFFEIM